MGDVIRPLPSRFSQGDIRDLAPVHHRKEKRAPRVPGGAKNLDHLIFTSLAFKVGHEAISVQNSDGSSHSSRSLAFSSIRVFSSFPFVPVMPARLRIYSSVMGFITISPSRSYR